MRTETTQKFSTVTARLGLENPTLFDYEEKSKRQMVRRTKGRLLGYHLASLQFCLCAMFMPIDLQDFNQRAVLQIS